MLFKFVCSCVTSDILLFAVMIEFPMTYLYRFTRTTITLNLKVIGRLHPPRSLKRARMQLKRWLSNSYILIISKNQTENNKSRKWWSSYYVPCTYKSLHFHLRMVGITILPTYNLMSQKVDIKDVKQLAQDHTAILCCTPVTSTSLLINYTPI